MFSAQNNRIYCSDCNKPYVSNIFSNHSKSKGHKNAVMQKRCNFDLTRCNNLELTCSLNSLSLEPNDTIKTDFQTLKNIIKSEQTKGKVIDSDILLLTFRNYHDSESSTEAKAVLQNVYRVLGIIWGKMSFATMDLHI